MGIHSKSYALDINAGPDPKKDQPKEVEYIVTIDRRGKKQGFAVAKNIMLKALNNIADLAKEALKHYSCISFKVKFVLRNVNMNQKFDVDDHSVYSDNDIVRGAFIVPYAFSDTKFIFLGLNRYTIEFDNCNAINIYSDFMIPGIFFDIKNSKIGKIFINQSNMATLRLNAESSVNTISVRAAGSQIDICDNVNIKYIHYSHANYNILSSLSNIKAVYATDSYLDFNTFETEDGIKGSIDCASLTRSKVNIKSHYIKIGDLYCNNSIIDHDCDCELECGRIYKDESVIEGELIGYKILVSKRAETLPEQSKYMTHDNLRIAKVRIPADAKRFLSTEYKPVIRAERVEVLEIYTINDQYEITGESDDSAFNFMHYGAKVQYHKGEIIEAENFNDNILDWSVGGIYCFRSLAQALDEAETLYEEYHGTDNK